jgi:hypothetical protein
MELRNFTYVARNFASGAIITLLARDCGRIRPTLSLPRSASILEPTLAVHFIFQQYTLQMFAKHTKHYQNVNSKRLQLRTVYPINIEGQSCVIFDIFLASDLTCMDTPTSFTMGGLVFNHSRIG